MTTTAPDVDLAELVGDVKIECSKDDCTAIAAWLVLARCGGCQDVLDAPNCNLHKTQLIQLMTWGVITSRCCERIATFIAVRRL
jgi:hypothetical protein